MRFRGGAPGGGVVARVSAHRIFRPLVNPAVLPRTPPFAAGITYGVNITPVLRPALCDVSLLQSVRWQYDASGRFQGGCSCLPQQFVSWFRFRLAPVEVLRIFITLPGDPLRTNLCRSFPAVSAKDFRTVTGNPRRATKDYSNFPLSSIPYAE